MRSFVKGMISSLAAALILYIAIWLPWAPLWAERPTITSDIETAFRATCKVKSKNMTGTGVLLNTGYIITAAHVVDTNGDGEVESKERDLTLEFFDGLSKEEIGGRLLFLDSTTDYAIIEPAQSMGLGVPFLLEEPVIGEPLFTLGCAAGLDIHVGKGYKSGRSEVTELFDRATIDVYGGNSGGGIFNEEQALIGIVHANMTKRNMARIFLNLPTFLDGKMGRAVGYAFVPSFDVIPGWTEYSESGSIYLDAVERNLDFTLIARPITTNWQLILGLVSATIQIILVLLICLLDPFRP